MNNFLQYANAAQKALRIGVTTAHKEFFENLPQKSTTKLEFIVGEEQKGGKRHSRLKKSIKKGRTYSKYLLSYKKKNTKYRKKNKKNTKYRKKNKKTQNTNDKYTKDK